MPEPSRYPLGHYTWDIHWIRSHVGVWRGECERCGLTVQAGEGQGGDDLRYQLKNHVCDPSKKGPVL